MVVVNVCMCIRVLCMFPLGCLWSEWTHRSSSLKLSPAFSTQMRYATTTTTTPLQFFFRLFVRTRRRRLFSFKCTRQVTTLDNKPNKRSVTTTQVSTRALISIYARSIQIHFLLKIVCSAEKRQAMGSVGRVVACVRIRFYKQFQLVYKRPSKL